MRSNGVASLMSYERPISACPSTSTNATCGSACAEDDIRDAGRKSDERCTPLVWLAAWLEKGKTSPCTPQHGAADASHTGAGGLGW